MKYLKSRWTGKNDWIWFHAEPKTEIKNIAKEIGFDLKKPIVTALTNVFWDAQLHYKANAFKNMLEWLEETIAYFSTRTDLQLVIRIHPAEVRGAIPSRQPIEEELQKIFKKIPKNIFIISPQNQASTYVLCQHRIS